MICCIGINHRDAAVAERESLAAADAALAESLAAYRDAGLGAVVRLSTCNRAEWYVLADSAELLQATLAVQHPVGATLLQERGYQLHGFAALHHLFRVAASLDSLVVGEPQILGQLKDAYEAACRVGVVCPLLHKIFQRALQAAKKVRQQTGIGERPVSVGSVAVALAGQIFGGLQESTVLVLGAGDVGQTVVQHLRSARVARVVVANRTTARGAAVAGAWQAEAIAWDAWPDAARQADIMVHCAAGQVLDATQVAHVQQARRGRPLFVIDLAVPRGVAADVAGLPEVYLYNIDDLEAVAQKNVHARRGVVDEAETLLVAAARSCWNDIADPSVGPVIALLHQKCDAIRREELRRTMDRLGSGDPRLHEALEACTRAIVSKILHDPIMRLKEEQGAGAPNTSAATHPADWLKRLFGLST